MGKLAVGVLLWHDNAPVHTSQVAIREGKFEQLNHHLYSQGLAQRGYHLFRNEVPHA